MRSASSFGYYLLRPSEPADFPTVVALERDCQSDPWPQERVEAFVTTPHEGHEQFGIIALLDSQVVGYSLVAIGGGNMSIERIGVLPDHRRRRAGTKLIAMAILEGRVRNLEFMVTLLRETNLVAQKFFYECGFRAGRITGPLKGWFGTEDAIAMRRPVVLPISSAGQAPQSTRP